MRSSWILLVLLTTGVMVSAGTPGSFRGTIVEGPHTAAEKTWIFVQGRNGMARRVEISRARITYDEDVPAAERREEPIDALTTGTEVRITAEQGSDGEWRASRVEILSRQPSAVSNQQPASSNSQCRIQSPYFDAACPRSPDS